MTVVMDLVRIVEIDADGNAVAGGGEIDFESGSTLGDTDCPLLGGDSASFTISASGDGTAELRCDYSPTKKERDDGVEVNPGQLKCDIEVSNFVYMNSANRIGIEMDIISTSTGADDFSACVNGFCAGDAVFDWVDKVQDGSAEFDIAPGDLAAAGNVIFAVDEVGATSFVWDPRFGVAAAGGLVPAPVMVFVIALVAVLGFLA